MDDLDHSMHIAEYDWTSFYEESEECGLLQPLIAWPDNLSLSDSEDSENSSLLFSAGQREPQQSPDVSRDEAGSNAAGCCMEEVKMDHSGSGGEQDDLTTKAQVDSEICLNYHEGNILNTEQTSDNITTALQAEQLNVQSSDGESTELKKEDGDLQTESDTCKLVQKPDPLYGNQTELQLNEPHTTDRAVSEDVSSVALRAEKERWFVTVNDSPARQRVHAPSVKKKRRQKKTRKVNYMCRTPGQEKSLKNDLELEFNKDKKSEGGRDAEYVTQSNQNLVKKSGGYSSAEDNITDLAQMSSEEDCSSEKRSHSPKENIIEPTIDRNKHDPSSSASTLRDTFTPKDHPRSDSVESDVLEDCVEFLSTHSYDSESYMSAPESVEERQHLLMENQQLQSSLSVSSYLLNLTENTDADDTQDREMHSRHTTLSCNVTATNSEGYESADVEPTLMFPSAGQSANKMPDDNSTCDNDTHSTLLCRPADTRGLQKHEMNLPASGGSSGDQFSLLPIPDLTVTPCSVPDSPETYAKAAGNARPVYAISAFWDEMEKLTINDILQLRVGRSTPPRETQETATPNIDDNSSLGDTVECNLSDGGLMDTSDAADSDYFTQPDESKPDRSSCEFSTSDFEEEYWQFLGASRNPSPDPQSKNQQRTSDSPFPTREEEESTSSEGKETPVPSEDFEGQCFEDRDSNALLSSELAWPRRITKSKSVRDVKALNTQDLSLQLLLGNDESSLFLSSRPALEENVVLRQSNSLGTLKPASFLSDMHILDEHTQISFPEVFECFSTEDKAKSDSRCVTVYDPEDISVAPVFYYTICTLRDEISFSSLLDSQCGEEKPIPIFSSSHPTVRELTFPNPAYVFLSADYEGEDDISPIRVVSRSFMLGTDCGTSAAAARGRGSWRSLLSVRKIRFHDKGSIWCRSGAWVFPVEAEINSKKADAPMTALTEGRVSLSPSQLFREPAVQQRILEAIPATRREGIFSTLRQSDMCLVCIAFASWVLRSSDPEAADAWKAALLANVSALSAIQYLRQYVKKKNPSQDGP